MVRSVPLGVLLGIASGIGLLACVSGPGRDDVAYQVMVDRICELAIECDCAEHLFRNECEPLDFGGFDDDDFDPLAELGFDESCAQMWRPRIDALSCGAFTSPPSLAESCPMYFGTVAAGMPCETDTHSLSARITTDCARGHYCISGICQDPGSIEFGTQDAPCGFTEGCNEGLHCDDGRCLRTPRRGEACPDRVCIGGTRCVDELCVALPGPGDPCLQGDCRSDSRCDSGTCIRNGEIGDSCFGHAQCISQNCPAGRCRPPATEGDPCSGNLPCGPGHRCVSSVCESDPSLLDDPNAFPTCEFATSLLL